MQPSEPQPRKRGRPRGSIGPRKRLAVAERWLGSTDARKRIAGAGEILQRTPPPRQTSVVLADVSWRRLDDSADVRVFKLPSEMALAVAAIRARMLQPTLRSRAVDVLSDMIRADLTSPTAQSAWLLMQLHVPDERLPKIVIAPERATMRELLRDNAVFVDGTAVHGHGEALLRAAFSEGLDLHDEALAQVDFGAWCAARLKEAETHGKG